MYFYKKDVFYLLLLYSPCADYVLQKKSQQIVFIGVSNFVCDIEFTFYKTMAYGCTI